MKESATLLKTKPVLKPRISLRQRAGRLSKHSWQMMGTEPGGEI
jgi:hypothetical protein